MKRIYTPHAPGPIGPYSQAIKVGNFIFLSGQIPIDPETGKIVGGIREQTEQVIKNIAAILNAAGASLDSVVRAIVYMKDLNEFSEMNEIYEKYFGASKPARVTVGVSALPKNARIEMEVTAYLGDK